MMTQIIKIFISALAKTAIALDQEDSCCHLVDLKTGHHFVSDLVGDIISGLVCQCGAVSYDTKDELDYVHLGLSGIDQEHAGKSRGQDKWVKRQMANASPKFVSSNISSEYQCPSVDEMDTTLSDNDQGQRLNMKQSDVVDAYLPGLNALKTAVGVSCMVLGIHNYVQDVN
jgi:hypothetical protein